MSDLILHHYPQSPVAQKIRLALGIAGVSWHSVEIPRLPPKPLLTPLTANYRRVPVMQIGADVYCDSQNIIRAIAETGYGDVLFPNGCVGEAMALASWAETTLFDLCVRLVITSAIGSAPPEFITDRASLYFKSGWTTQGMKAALPAVTLQLQASLRWVDTLLEMTGYTVGQTHSYADAAIASIAWFLRGRWDGGAALLAPFGHICRLEAEIVEKGQGYPSDLQPEEALAIAHAHEPVSPTGIYSGFDAGLTHGQRVVIRPDGETADPEVFGALRYLDDTRASIDHYSPETGPVAVHFPLAGYMLSPAGSMDVRPSSSDVLR
jgi:glutathione S-transferase|tara:strand:+ start:8216 stop:9181 length:966 start_codon:yes stop_codon:yes gene_type:complete